MTYRLEHKNAFRIVGLTRRVRLIYEGINSEIAAMYEELGEARLVQLKALSDVEPIGLLSASYNFEESRAENSFLDHTIGVATTAPAPEGLEALEVGAATWAVFETVGPFPETLQGVWSRIYTEWFPSSGYRQADGPELLWNAHKDTTAPDYRSEIWIPVQPV